MTGVYVHIPFCHSKCGYCDFYSLASRNRTLTASRVDRFVEALEVEWRERRSEVAYDRLSTIYIGGGTPSSLPSAKLGEILDIIGPNDWEESTIECNPEDVTPSWINKIRDYGLSRVSMGIQSFDDRDLRLIGRRHSVQKAREAARLLIDSGLEVSLDLIYGLPGQTVDDWANNLRTMMSLRPPHLSAYLLSYEPGTRFWAMLQAGKIEEASEGKATEMYNLLCDMAREYGYDHYEISNFSLPGHKALHNSRYWSGDPYIGLGPSAHSFDGTKRRFNPPALDRYLKSLLEDGVCPFVVEEEDEMNRLNDTIITRLRTSAGLDLGEITAKFGAQITQAFLSDASPLVERGLLTRDGASISIPERHWLTSDAIMREIVQV